MSSFFSIKAKSYHQLMSADDWSRWSFCWDEF